jgi:hypothetical protein
MKKIFLVFSLLLLACVVRSQAPFPSSEEIRQFMASKTCVVLDNAGTVYNALIKKAVGDCWKITPVEYIKRDEFEKRRKDPSFSFLILTETNFERDKSFTRYNFINLLQGKSVNGINEMPEICAVPLSPAGEDDTEFGYKMEAVLNFIQKHATMISADPSLTGRRYLKYYNKNVPEVAGRTILVMEEDLSPAVNTIDKIRVYYKNSIRIVPEDTIIQAITEKKPKTLVLVKVGPPSDNKSHGFCFKMLIGTDDNDMYYYNQHLIDNNNPDGLLPADLKRLARF